LLLIDVFHFTVVQKSSLYLSDPQAAGNVDAPESAEKVCASFSADCVRLIKIA